MKRIRTEDAVGHVLCHDMTQIIPGQFKGPRFRKGHVVRPEDIPAILDSGNRTLAGPTAPPGGLSLTRVWYEDERLNGKMGV